MNARSGVQPPTCRLAFLLCLFLNLASSSAFAISFEEKLPPFQEEQAQEIFHQVRCMVCTGESIADSRAELAMQMRALIREKVKSGQSEGEVLQSLADSYGQEILMQPPFNPSTWILWVFPVFALVVGGVLMALIHRVKRPNREILASFNEVIENKTTTYGIDDFKTYVQSVKDKQ